MELHGRGSGVFKCAGTLTDGTEWGCGKEFAHAEALTRHSTVFFSRSDAKVGGPTVYFAEVG